MFKSVNVVKQIYATKKIRLNGCFSAVAVATLFQPATPKRIKTLLRMLRESSQMVTGFAKNHMSAAIASTNTTLTRAQNSRLTFKREYSEKSKHGKHQISPQKPHLRVVFILKEGTRGKMASSVQLVPSHISLCTSHLRCPPPSHEFSSFESLLSCLKQICAAFLVMVSETMTHVIGPGAKDCAGIDDNQNNQSRPQQGPKAVKDA